MHIGSVIITEPISIFSVTPGVVFKYKTDVEILVEGDPILDEPSLACRIHDYIIPGVRIINGTSTYVKCILPSFDAIEAAAQIPIPSTNEVSIEISNNGINFSNEGFTITFLEADQVDDIYPWNGPNTGGTSITIELKLNQTQGEIGDVYCQFFGNETIEATKSPPSSYV